MLTLPIEIGKKYVTRDGCLVNLLSKQMVEASAAQESLHTFLNAAAGDGLILDGVDAADLYIKVFPERYAAALKDLREAIISARSQT